MLKWIFKILNNALMIFFDVKWCFNDLFCVRQYLKWYFLIKWYFNEIQSLRFIYSHSTLLISFIFDLIGENLTRPVWDLNGTRQKEFRWSKWDLMEQFSQKFESRPFSPDQRKSCQNGTRLKQNEMKAMMNEMILKWNEIGKNSSLVHAYFRVLFSFKLVLCSCSYR